MVINGKGLRFKILQQLNDLVIFYLYVLSFPLLLLFIQVVENILYKLDDDKEAFYETLEKMYNVELHHFKRLKDEL